MWELQAFPNSDMSKFGYILAYFIQTSKIVLVLIGINFLRISEIKRYYVKKKHKGVLFANSLAENGCRKDTSKFGTAI